MSEVAGPPQAFGPGGPPKAFGPPGGASASASTTRSDAKGKPSAGGQTAGAGGASSSKSNSASGGSAGTKAGSSTPTSAGSSASSGTAAKGAAPDVKLPIAAGTIVRISGLKAQPALNGERGQILHAADPGPERLVVRTRLGDKSLKPANLQVGRAVLPKGTVSIWIVITVLSIAVVTDVFRSGGHSAVSAAAVPAVSALWLTVTSLLTIYLNWPGREPGTWIASVSEMGTNSPPREFYRFGFLSAGGMFAVTVWLYGQLVVVQLADAPPPMPLTEGVNATSLNSSMNQTMLINESSSTILADVSPAASAVEDPVAAEGHNTSDIRRAAEGDSATEDVVAEDAKTDANETALAEDVANDTVSKNSTKSSVNQTALLESAPERSMKWGYVTAFGLALQGIFVYDGRLAWRSWINFAGFAAFGVGLFQHCTLTSLIISSVRGKPFMEASPMLASVVKGRRWITDYVPLLLLAAPLSSQIFNSSKMRYNYQQPTFRTVLKDSGMLTSARVMQWIAVMVFVIFYSTFAFDLWVAAKLIA